MCHCVRITLEGSFVLESHLSSILLSVSTSQTLKFEIDRCGKAMSPVTFLSQVLESAESDMGTETDLLVDFLLSDKQDFI